MERTASALLHLFIELGVVGRRAIRRGNSTTIERLARESKVSNEKWIEAAPKFRDEIKTWATPTLQELELDPFDEVSRAVLTANMNWAAENLFYVHNWHPFEELIELNRDVPFAALLYYLSEQDSDNVLNDDLDHIFSFLRVTPLEVLDADSDSLLQTCSGEEVLLGYGRLSSLAAMLTEGTVPDDRYTDAERELYFRSIDAHNRERDWLFWDLWRYSDSLRARFERAQRVEKLMLLHPMSPFIAIYLRTVYRTYVEGFMPETVVMCRALLERSAKRACAALGIAFVDSKSDTLHSRLELLKRHKWLSAELMRDAHDVRNRGNVSVHEDPTMVRDSYGTVEAALRVVNAIETQIKQNSK